MRREFLMLAKVWDRNKHKIGGWYASEKLDGIRCFWDGGLSRDVPTTSVPWANTTDPKTGQPKRKIKPLATGLWSRYGNPIAAPEWFLNSLPCCPLDGELWAGRGGFQTVTSVCKKDVPEDGPWHGIQFAVFGAPNIWQVFQDGEIRNTNFVKKIECDNIKRWIQNRDRDILESYTFLEGNPFFAAEIANLNEWLDTTSETCFMVSQTKLPMDHNQAAEVVVAMKTEIISNGGEGVFLRNPFSHWAPKRVDDCLKVKGSNDDECTVVGFISGRETEKGSKLLGLIGSLIVDYKGRQFELSGLTDEERQFSHEHETRFAIQYPGTAMPPGTRGLFFKPGDRVTFTYRELTNDGVPKEARYQRKRND